MEIGREFVVAAAWACFSVMAIRNSATFVQLLVAARVFVTRERPASRAAELWPRFEEVAPAITVVAPAFNEELSIADSVRALLALEYPDHQVLVVNDGSTDRTLDVLIQTFALRRASVQQFATLQVTDIRGVYRSEEHPNLIVVDKQNGRKADAVNAGLGFVSTPLVCVIDADSIIEPDGLLRAAEPFLSDNGSLVAVGGAIRIVNGCKVEGGSLREIGLPKDWLPRFQVVEYIRAFLMARVATAHLDSLTLISGAFGLFRRDVLIEIGGYRHDTLAEDLELLVRLHRKMRDTNRDYEIEFVPEVVCWTEAPSTWGGLKNQRARWQQGALETIGGHRKMLFNPRYGRIGMVMMPQVILEDVIGPPAELLGYFLLPAAWALGIFPGEALLAFLALTVAFGMSASVCALALEEAQLRRTPTPQDLARLAVAALIENLGYRQANLVFRMIGIKRHLRRQTAWSSVPRMGFSS